jgi:shikimate dehydrogenase
MRTFGLIGNPLDHSWSKEYFQEKFLKDNINGCRYINFQMDDASQVRDLVISDKSISGLNVTIPFKKEIISSLDNIDREARAIGAVNCIKVTRNENDIQLTGFNTDSLAFRETWQLFIDNPVKKAIVLGTGGASLAICYVLKELNIPYILVSRTKKPGVFMYDEITGDITESCQLIINTTPSGMYPETGQCPALPYQYIGKEHFLYDLVYNPEETLFLKNGRKMGAKTKNGLDMLRLQAEMSWSIWNPVED